MARLRNLLACLVHESPSAVVDLVRNLRYLNPQSPILLYNGGSDPSLLANGFPFQRYGAAVHPSPRPMAWGRLHGFALDCIAYALEHIEFDTLTVVDSDQLGLRPGWEDALASFLARHPRCGLMGSTAERHGAASRYGPVRAAWSEIELWRPFLNRFPDADSHFVHWTFWPSTTFTRDAASALAELFARDPQLNSILTLSKLWATEEVLFPTLAALLGFEVHVSPASYRYVRFREKYALHDVDHALGDAAAFWMHPVPRLSNDPTRKHIRERHGHYQLRQLEESPVEQESLPLVTTLPVLEKMRQVEGWLDDAEGDLLLAAAARAAATHGRHAALVEIGSYCGRSTVVIGSALAAICPDARLYAIDPHDGQVGSADTALQKLAPTMQRFLCNLDAAGVRHVVEPVCRRSCEIEWDRPVSFLFIDGLHDYESVASDFFHFEAHVIDGGLIAFHDYADYYPGVKSFVNEVLTGGAYRRVGIAHSLIVVEKLCGIQQTAARHIPAHATRIAEAPVAPATVSERPLVSCLMATCNRRALVPRAIEYFLRQDYPSVELLVIDDGSDAIGDLVPTDPRIRYLRLDRRHSMGQKHNIGCEQAHGDIILHWDDDDWMAGDRISRQVRHLLAQPGPALTGLARLFFFQPGVQRAWEYHYPDGGSPWVAGGTFCYPRALWRQHRFEDISEGADTRFAWNLRGAPVRPLTDHRFYVATVHPSNTSPKRTQDPRWRGISPAVVRELMGADWTFYEQWPLTSVSNG